MSKSIYQRLTGRKRTLVGFSQLWLAPDHLLLVRSTRFTEYYQRFSLADVQAIIVTELPDQVTLQVAVLAGVIASAAGFFSVASIFAKVFMAAVAMLALAILAGNILLGPRARCHLQTAVSQEILSPVTRMRSAQRFLARLRPAIEAAQGSLAPDRAAAIDGGIPFQEKPPDVPHPPGYLPEVLFLLFLVNAIIVLASVRFPQTQLANILLTTISGEVILAVVALVRRGGRDPRRFIYFLIAAAIAGIGWDGIHLAGSFYRWINGAMEAARQGQQGPPSMAS